MGRCLIAPFYTQPVHFCFIGGQGNSAKGHSKKDCPGACHMLCVLSDQCKKQKLSHWPKDCPHKKQ